MTCYDPTTCTHSQNVEFQEIDLRGAALIQAIEWAGWTWTSPEMDAPWMDAIGEFHFEAHFERDGENMDMICDKMGTIIGRDSEEFAESWDTDRIQPTNYIN